MTFPEDLIEIKVERKAPPDLDGEAGEGREAFGAEHDGPAEYCVCGLSREATSDDM